MLKSAVRRVLKHAGLEVRRIPRSTRAYPFVSHVTLAGVEFSFWVKDAEAEQWYSPEEHGKLVENQLLADLIARGGRVLHVGCHHGFYVVFLSKLVRTASYWVWT